MNLVKANNKHWNFPHRKHLYKRDNCLNMNSYYKRDIGRRDSEGGRPSKNHLPQRSLDVISIL